LITQIFGTACLAFMLAWEFRFPAVGNSPEELQAFDEQVLRVEDSARSALASTSEEYLVAVERVSETVHQFDSLPFLDWLYSRARWGRPGELKALGALATMKALSADMLDSSQGQEAKRYSLNNTIELVGIMREEARACEREFWEAVWSNSFWIWLVLIIVSQAALERWEKRKQAANQDSESWV
jgi:hypothetical protein